jgi:hypothetical protein
VLQGGVPLPVCVVEGCPSTCLCCRRVSSCLSVLLGCVPLPVRGPPELQSGMFLFWVLHSFFTPFLFTPWHCLGPLQPLQLILSMVFQLSLPPCKFSLCIFFLFLSFPGPPSCQLIPGSPLMASTISTNSLWPRILQHTPGIASSSQLRSFWASSHQY